ncbi:MAG: hypothetical protein K2Y05_10820 [Hyphomicrobiaceae bacterium]|nr:hypothetical protein [Hyphomicrobiaceae bacterium]
MKRLALIACLAVFASAPSAKAADCGAVVDELSKAISGHLTMSPERKVAMLRMVTSSYDYCIVGDAKSSAEIRDMLMTKIKEQLGGK